MYETSRNEFNSFTNRTRIESQVQGIPKRSFVPLKMLNCVLYFYGIYWLSVPTHANDLHLQRLLVLSRFSHFNYWHDVCYSTKSNLQHYNSLAIILYKTNHDLAFTNLCNHLRIFGLDFLRMDTLSVKNGLGDANYYIRNTETHSLSKFKIKFWFYVFMNMFAFNIISSLKQFTFSNKVSSNLPFFSPFLSARFRPEGSVCTR